MDTLSCIATRRSQRRFTDQQVEKEKIATILKAGQAAPIGHSYFKGYQLTVVQNKEVLEAYDKASSLAWGSPKAHLFYNAPTLIVVSAKPQSPELRVYACDCGCIMQNMQLAAVELGLGCVFLWGLLNRIPQDEAFTKALNLPEGFRPECILALGYPVPGTELKARTLEQVPDRLGVNFVD